MRRRETSGGLNVRWILVKDTHLSNTQQLRLRIKSYAHDNKNQNELFTNHTMCMHLTSGRLDTVYFVK